MAWSSDFGTSNSYVVFQLEVVPGSSDTANNRTPVTVRLWARRTNTGYTTWGTGYVTMSVDGVNRDSGTKSISITSSNSVMHEWSGYVNHNSDGTKTLTVTGSIQISGVLSSSVSSFSVALARIPRASTFTVNKSTCELGTSFTVTVSKAASSFTHSISYYMGAERRYLQAWNGTGTVASATPPLTDGAYMPNSTSYSTTVVVDTYSGSTLVGSASRSITFVMPASVVPTLGGGTKLTQVDPYWGLTIKGKSRLKVEGVSPQGAYSSTIRSVTIEAGGYSVTRSSAPWELTTGILNKSGQNDVSVTVTDSRGRSKTYTNGFTVTDYFTPSIKDYYAYRCTQAGAQDPNGTYLKVFVDLTYCVVGSNTNTCKFRYREGNGTWSSYTTLTNKTAWVGGGGFKIDKTYVVEITAGDYFSNINVQVPVNTALFPIDVLNDGNGVAFGKAAESAGFMDVGFKAWFRDQSTFAEKSEFRGGIQEGTSYSDGKGYYHFTNGFLVTTNIKKSINTMFEFYITGNSYGTQLPIDIKVNGYVYNSGLTNCSALCDAYNVPMSLFFDSNDNLCLWLQQASTYNTFRFKLCTTFGQLTPSYTVTDSAKPSGITVDTSPNVHQGYNSKNSWVIVERGENANGRYIRFSDGTQICFKRFEQRISNLNAWGSLFESYTFSLGAWPASFKANTQPVANVQCGQSAFYAWVTTCHSTSPTNVGTISICRPTNISNTTAILYIIGMGVWK